MDPRVYQTVVLGSLLVYGLARLDFELQPLWIAATTGAALAAQWCCGRLYHRARFGRGGYHALRSHFDPWSALISALSLCLLLRAPGVEVMIAAAVVAIASKFLLRVGDRHVWNPSNLAIVVMLALDLGWVSPAQWGSAAYFGLLVAGAGSFVVVRAARVDVSAAFLASWAALLFGRALVLGDPLAIPLRQLQGGALLIFAFYMISDPKTTPRTRGGRVAFAALVAVGAFLVQFVLWRQDGLLWSLAACSPLVPLIDRALARAEGNRPRRAPRSAHSLLKETKMTRPSPLPLSSIAVLPLLLLLSVAAAPAHAFCGFYVAQAGSELFNRSSRVVLVRDGDRTVLTMENDYQGDPSEFAMVVPVPTILAREQIHVGDRATLDHLDAFTAPRLVEYFDQDPCELERRKGLRSNEEVLPAAAAMRRLEADSATGVRIEAKYSVGEYEILILSAEESDGLEAWLRGNGYRIPPGAGAVLRSYLRQGLYFFVAKVNLERQRELGFERLRPLQMAYESPRFMLPIRLGMVNAEGPQELFLFALSRRGRVEPTNYRTTRLPSGVDVPVFVKEEFPRFYGALFGHHVQRERMRTVVLEHAWDMAWCDPCAADPLSTAQLRALGVFWVDPAARAPANDVFVTRLHVRYDAAGFPDDLVLRETGDRTNFQGRYVMRHAWKGEARCAAARDYLDRLPARWEEEARSLAALTGWELEEIRERMELGRPIAETGKRSWWDALWNR